MTRILGAFCCLLMIVAAVAAQDITRLEKIGDVVKTEWFARSDRGLRY